MAHPTINTNIKIGSPTATNQKTPVSSLPICDAPSLQPDPSEPESTVAPGTQESNAQVVQGIWGGDGLRVAMSVVSQEMCHASCTRTPFGKSGRPVDDRVLEDGPGVLVAGDPPEMSWKQASLDTGPMERPAIDEKLKPLGCGVSRWRPVAHDVPSL